MGSLTRALQIELKMTQFSDLVGPATLGKLETYGPIGGNDANVNLRTIVQAALYCKGYRAGAINGDWGGTFSGYETSATVKLMMTDMGIGEGDGRVPPKVAKSLLTMDAYVCVGLGTEEVRLIQQWLNERYWTRPWASIAPADGNYSRDVQKALVRAIQAEMGFSDDNITGSVGPMTRNGLKSKELNVDATGIFVQLLSAAAVFNGTVPDDQGQLLSTAFKSTFDTKLSQYLGYFQTFAQIPTQVKGMADFATWCELLISTGDPDRAVTGCDTSRPLTPATAQALRAGPYRIVGRYLQNSNVANPLNKRLQDGEVALIHTAGLRIFPIWQYSGGSLADFTRDKGYIEGQLGHDRMAYYKFAPGSIAYFAVDYDAMDGDISSNIVPYFQGVLAGFQSRGRRFQVGVYGPRNVCTRVTHEAGVSASFVSGMSTGFSGNLGFPLPANWAFNQIKEFTFGTGSSAIPLDNVLHRQSADPGIGPENMAGSPSPVAAVTTSLRGLYATAVSYGGADANLRTMEYLRATKYTQDYGGWDILLDRWDDAWLAAADAATFDRAAKSHPTYDDPYLNVPIEIDHLAATANAVWAKGEGNGAIISCGDFGGWAGDLVSFACDFAATSGVTAQNFCQSRLAKVGVPSSWALDDLIEDVDGAAIGLACKTGTSFPDAFNTHLAAGGPATTRFNTFIQRRFSSNAATIKQACYNALFDQKSTSVDSTVALLVSTFYLKSDVRFYNPLGWNEEKRQAFVTAVANELLLLAAAG